MNYLSFLSYLCNRKALGRAAKGQKEKSQSTLTGLHFLLPYYLYFLFQYLLAANDIDAFLHLAQTLAGKIVYGSLFRLTEERVDAVVYSQSYQGIGVVLYLMGDADTDAESAGTAHIEELIITAAPRRYNHVDFIGNRDIAGFASRGTADAILAASSINGAAQNVDVAA